MNALDHFIEHQCVGKQYDSCVNSPCLYSRGHGCGHPEHPKNQSHHDHRDRGDPMRKIDPDPNHWSRWEEQQDHTYQPGGRR